jgi:hypothetical protein
LLLPLWIVAGAAEPPIEIRHPEADTVFHCAFDAKWDRDYDGWPDGWTRRRGPGFPHYVEIEISKEESLGAGRCLRIGLDGGGAAVYSPPVPVDALFRYVVEGRLKAEGLEHDRAFLSITLLDGEGSRLRTFTSQKVLAGEGWQDIRLGPIAAQSQEVRSALIGVHVEPTDREDLDATVWIAGVWMGRLPRFSLHASDPGHWFSDPTEVAVTLTASGRLPRDAPVTFRLEDALGRELAREDLSLATRPAEVPSDTAPEGSASEGETVVGTARWRPPVEGPGFYRVTALVQGKRGTPFREQTSLVVTTPQRPPPGGRFGWSLPGGERPLPMPLLARLLVESGIGWVKYPVWPTGEAGEEQAERLAEFADRLGAHDIELVGLLAEPQRDSPISADLAAKTGTVPVSGSQRPLGAADLFAPEPDAWYPSIEPVMTRMATRVRWWQLGHDRDTSFVGHPELHGRLAAIKAELDRIGQDVDLGIGWSWQAPMPQAQAERPPWRFLSLWAEPPLGPQELADHLDATREATARRWVAIVPLSSRRHAVDVRAADLVHRMIAAKIHGADAIFCAEPFSSDHGLLSDDGAPGDLVLPWRTTALLLGGAEYLGGIELPGASPNHVFVRDDDVVMVVFNDHAQEEVIYLGEDVEQVDLWGRVTRPEQRGHRQVVRVGRLPTFITGVDGPVAHWRMAVRLDRDRIPSILGQPHANTLTFGNRFADDVAGQLELVGPPSWSIEPRSAAFDLPGGEVLSHPFTVLLPFSATSGEHPIRVDFEIGGERPRRFSAYHRLHVGLGDVRVDMTAQLGNHGELEVHQRITNETGAPVSFTCQLFAPGRRRLTSQVTAPAEGSDARVYRLAEGRELVGQELWLRAEEIGGPRVLSQRFVAAE